MIAVTTYSRSRSVCDASISMLFMISAAATAVCLLANGVVQWFSALVALGAPAVAQLVVTPYATTTATVVEAEDIGGS